MSHAVSLMLNDAAQLCKICCSTHLLVESAALWTWGGVMGRGRG
jgi:hypothetical protein